MNRIARQCRRAALGAAAVLFAAGFVGCGGEALAPWSTDLLAPAQKDLAADPDFRARVKRDAFPSAPVTSQVRPIEKSQAQ
jgi:hypothetical protein